MTLWDRLMCTAVIMLVVGCIVGIYVSRWGARIVLGSTVAIVALLMRLVWVLS